MKLTETKKEYQVSGKVECGSCKGTGLYNGFAEKDGARVVCYNCKGSGEIEINLSWNKFFERKIEKGCSRVYTNGMGYAITDKDVTTKEGRFMPFSKYGCSYEDWQKGVKPEPLEFLGCPYMETNQNLQSEDKNNLYKTRCKDNLGWGRISQCKLFHDKENCWKIFKG